MIKIVMPVYNEGNQIYNNVLTVHNFLKHQEIEHGFFLVDDGSKDNTWQELKKIVEVVEYTEILQLSRNFGKEAALCAALENVEGDAVIVMDCDLQHPYTKIPEMIRLWQEREVDIVHGVKADRGKESILYRIFAKSYYKLFNSFTKLNMNNASDFKLLSKKALEGWRQCREFNTYFRGMSNWVGFKSVEMPFHVEERKEGQSKWKLSSLIKLTITSITSYTSSPLMFVLWLGLLMGFGGIVLLIQTLYMYFSGQSLTGFSTVILLQLFTGCGIMVGISVIGLYISRIYEEVKNRPRFLVQEHITSKSKK